MKTIIGLNYSLGHIRNFISKQLHDIFSNIVYKYLRAAKLGTAKPHQNFGYRFKTFFLSQT